MNPVKGVDASYDLLTFEKAQALMAQDHSISAVSLGGNGQPGNRVINCEVHSRLHDATWVCQHHPNGTGSGHMIWTGCA